MTTLEEDAKNGDADAQNNLGAMYHYGYCLEQDHKKALEWFRKAAEQGHALAQFNPGGVYHKGCGVERNQAKEFFTKAASSDNPDVHAAINRLLFPTYPEGGINPVSSRPQP